MLQKKLILSALSTLLILQGALAQVGTVSGNITETQNGAQVPVPFANVILMGTTMGGVTDFDGNYTFTATPGNYKLIVSYIGLLPDTSDLNIVADQTITRNVALQTSAQLIEGVEIVDRANTRKEDVLYMERKDDLSIAEKIGAEKMAATGNTTVSGGLTKVAGLSVVGSRHVFVRGMGDRYNSAYLNGMPLPSADPDKKVMPLNIFPTAIVNSLSVDKAFTSNLYGDFAGGAINIRTRQYPDKPTLNVTVGTGVNTSSTFRNLNTYDGGSTDYFGRDDGTRTIPAEVLPQADEYVSDNENRSGYAFEKNLNPVATTVPVNSKMSIQAGNFYATDSIREGSGIGVMLVASHSNQTSFRDQLFRQVQAQDGVRIDYDVENYRQSTNSSILGTVLLQLDQNNQIAFNSLFVNTSTDDFRETRGFHFDYENLIFTRRVTYRENDMWANQVTGTHSFLENGRVRVNWGAMRSQASAKEPDRRQLVFLYEDENTPTTNYTLNARDVQDNHRFFTDLQEQETSVMAEIAGDLLMRKKDPEAAFLTLKAGINMKDKNRDFDYRQFNYRINSLTQFFPNGVDINDPDASLNDQTHDEGAFNIEELANLSSDYNATLDVMAPYGEVQVTPFASLTVIAGARFEDGQQTIRYKEQNQSFNQLRETISGVDFLPSVTARYQLFENTFVRSAYSKTISRPGFLEVAPFQYIEFFAAAQTVGNPELTNGSIHNIDARIETFPKGGEVVGLTAFYKTLQDPIERVNTAVPSGQVQSYVNANEAVVYGLEFEAVKKLSSFVGDSTLLSNISVGFNATVLHSEVRIDTNIVREVNGASVINTNLIRPLQGASPYLVNLDLTYAKWLNPKTKFSSTASYNIFGRRLWSAGAQGIGDTYEIPVSTVNVTARLELNDKYVFSLSGKNLLNPNIRLEQESSLGDDIEINSFRTGIVLGASFTYKFL